MSFRIALPLARYNTLYPFEFRRDGITSSDFTVSHYLRAKASAKHLFATLASHTPAKSVVIVFFDAKVGEN